MYALKYLVYFAFDLAVIGCSIHYVYMCLHKRAAYVQWFAEFEREFGLTRVWTSLLYLFYFFLILFGIGFCIFHGVASLFSWMPHTWTDADGEPLAQLLG